jgi:hypothetical protein
MGAPMDQPLALENMAQTTIPMATGDVEPGAGGTGVGGGEAEEFAAGEAAEQGSEAILDEEGDEDADHGGAEESDVLEHFTELEALLGGFGAGEVLAEEHEAVDGGGDQEAAELEFPAAGGEGAVDETTDHHASRPGGVEDVEVVGSVVGEESGHQRVGDGFQGAVRDREEEGAGPQIREGGLRGHAVGGSEGYEGGEDMEGERRGDEFPVADAIDDDAADRQCRSRSR